MEADLNIWKTRGLKSANICALHIMVSWVPTGLQRVITRTTFTAVKMNSRMCSFLTDVILAQNFLARLIQERREQNRT